MAYTVAKIAVSNISYHIDKPYSYRIPSEFSESLQVGMRVLVPFGRGNTKKEAIVLSLTNEETDKLKPDRKSVV